MKHWLIIYDRRASRLLACDEYDDAQRAIRDRFQWEKYFLGLDVEVVVLGADSLETIKQTHGRYFYSTQGLLDRMQAWVRAGGPTPWAAWAAGQAVSTANCE